MTARETGLLIVVPCLDEERHLPPLLAQLRGDNPAALIVVADGGSRDRSREIVAAMARTDPGIVLLDNPDRIQSTGINRAVAAHHAGREWLLRIDAHCQYPPAYAARLLAAAEERGATSVAVPMVSKGDGCFQRAAAAAQNSVLGTGGSPHRHVGEGRFVDHGHHALMRLALFRGVGGYREDMSHNEDAELDLRLIAAGGRIWLETGLALTYFPRSDPRGLWRQYFGYGRGRARTLVLHRRRPKLRQLVPLAVAGALGLALLAPWMPLLAAPLIAWAVLVTGAGLVVGARAGGGCALFAGVPAMISHLAWSLGFLRGLAQPLARTPAQSIGVKP
jgi:succinoglycan biosynthesis protein ExoA